MTDIAEIAKAIMDRFEASANLKSVMSGGLFFQQASQDLTGSYGVFYINEVTQEEIMGGADDNITEVGIQFNIFTDVNDGGEQIALLTSLFTEAYDWQEINVIGYKYIKMQRENILPLGFVDEVWQSSINYTLGIQKE
jgi:hypothetical protein